MATKTPSKGKKAAAKGGTPKKRAAKKPAKAAAPPREAKEPKESKALEEPILDEEAADLDGDDEEAPRAAAKPAVPGLAPKKPTAKPMRGADMPEAPPVVPARRLTPEAKARVNEMVKKGVPLGEALRAAASWETFVAPVKDEPAKLVQGKGFDGGGNNRPFQRHPRREEEEPAGVVEDADEPVPTSSDED